VLLRPELNVWTAFCLPFMSEGRHHALVMEANDEAAACQAHTLTLKSLVADVVAPGKPIGHRFAPSGI
jgi:hypothetical protein